MVLFDTLEFAEDVMKNEPVLPIPYEEPWEVNPERGGDADEEKTLESSLEKWCSFARRELGQGAWDVIVIDDGGMKNFDGLPKWISDWPVFYTGEKDTSVQYSRAN